MAQYRKKLMEWLTYMRSSQTVRTRISLAASARSVTRPSGSDAVQQDVAMSVVFMGNVVSRNANETVSSMTLSRLLSDVRDAAASPLVAELP